MPDEPDDEASKPPEAVVKLALIRPAKETDASGPISSTVAMPVVPTQPNAPGTGPTRPSALPMIACPDCKTLTPALRFCSECGAALVKRRFCAECGQKLEAGAKFCEACGTKVP
jgi:hypothetical protein